MPRGLSAPDARQSQANCPLSPSAPHLPLAAGDAGVAGNCPIQYWLAGSQACKPQTATKTTPVGTVEAECSGGCAPARTRSALLAACWTAALQPLPAGPICACPGADTWKLAERTLSSSTGVTVTCSQASGACCGCGGTARGFVDLQLHRACPCHHCPVCLPAAPVQPCPGTQPLRCKHPSVAGVWICVPGDKCPDAIDGTVPDCVNSCVEEVIEPDYAGNDRGDWVRGRHRGMLASPAWAAAACCLSPAHCC